MQRVPVTRPTEVARPATTLLFKQQQTKRCSKPTHVITLSARVVGFVRRSLNNRLAVTLLAAADRSIALLAPQEHLPLYPTGIGSIPGISVLPTFASLSIGSSSRPLRPYIVIVVSAE